MPSPFATRRAGRPMRRATVLLALATACSGSDPEPVTRTVTRTTTVTAPCVEQLWYVDDDGDGWGDGSAAVLACEAPPGAAPQGDCDDADPSIHPEAVDSPLDDVDQDCSGEPATEPDCSDEGAVWIDGSLAFEGPDAEDAMVEACAQGNRLGGDLVLDGTDATRVPVLRCLCEVAGAVRLTDNPTLEAVVATDLTRVGGDVVVRGAPALTQLDLSVDEIGGSLIVQDAPQLGDWELDVDALDGDLVLERSGTEGFVDLDLGAFDGSVRIDGVSWSSISLDVEKVHDLDLTGSPALETLNVDGPTDELEVDGDLLVEDNSVLTALDLGGGFASDLCISRIGGTLHLTDNPDLRLDATPSCLTNVGGDYVVTNLPANRSLQALDPVSIGGDILVADLSMWDGIVLASTTSVGGSVHVERVDAYDVLPVLMEIPGDLELQDLDMAFDNPPLAQLVTVGGHVDLVRAGGGLWGLEDVGGDVGIVGSGFTQLPELQSVDGDLTFVGAGEPPFTSFGSLSTGPAVVAGSVHLTNGSLYSSDIGILSVGGDLSLLGCAGEPVQPFATTHVMGTLRIHEGGAGLTELGMLSSLTHAGSLEIDANAALVRLDGLEGLASLEGGVLADLRLTHNPSLSSLEGLANLSTVAGSVTIDGNDSLVDLRGLEQLADIGSHLSVGEFSGNAALERLDGLEGLRTVGSELWINHNDVLTDVTAAHGIVTVDGRLLIQSNPSLATADAQALADAIPDKGTVSILDNAP